MRIGFVVNDVKTEEGKFTTSRLGQAAVNRGHEVWVMGVGDLAYDPDAMVRVRATSVPKPKYGNSESYTAGLQGKNAVKRRITIDELDVLVLRNVPSDDYLQATVGVHRGLRICSGRHATWCDCVERSKWFGESVE